MFILYSLSTKRFVSLPKHGCKGTYYYLNEQGKQGLFIVCSLRSHKKAAAGPDNERLRLGG
jgi:hypothetical protein